MNQPAATASTLNAVLYLVLLVAALLVGRRVTGRVDGPSRGAIGLWLLVAVPSLVQFAVPGLEQVLRRDPDLIVHHGQVWRLLTGLVVQDGGAVGTWFNLVALAFVVAVAGAFWGDRWLWILFLAGHLVTTVLVILTYSTVGAGNSFATLALASSMVGASMTRVRLRRQPVSLLAFACGVVAVVLLWLSDPHGLAILTGLLLGALFRRQMRAKPRTPRVLM